MIANYAAMDIQPGSMGRPLPGVEATVLARDDDGARPLRDGAPVEVVEPGVEGELALRAGWPSMFRGYLHEAERYRRCFAGGWYLTGDLVRRDADGYFWFVGRADDVIKTSGHLIGPFEVESVLLEHPGGRRGGRDRRARPGRRRGRQGVRAARAPASSRARRCGARSVAPRAAGASAPPSRRARSPSPRRCRTPAAARSCAGCCAPASSGCRRATCRRWRPSHERPRPPRAAARARARRRACCARCCASAASRSAAPSSTRRAKIRGFLHLYIGEEAVAVGVDAGARPPTTPSSRPTASTGTRSCAACRAGAVMAEMFGRVEGCSRGRGGSMHLFDVEPPLLRRQRDRRRRAAARGRAGARRPHAGPPPRDRVLLRRGRRRRGRVPRVDEPRRAVAAAGAVLLREQPLRDGHRARAVGVRDRPGAQGGQLRDARLVGRRHGRAGGRGRRPTAPRPTVRDGVEPCFLELRTYRFRAHSMYDPDLYRTQGGDRALEGSTTRSPRSPSGCATTRLPATDAARDARGRGRRRGRRGRRVRRGGHARAGRGPGALRGLRGAPRAR